MSSDDFRSEPRTKVARAAAARPYSTSETDQTIGGLNGCAGSASGSDAILGYGIAVPRTVAMAGASLPGTTAIVGCAHKAAHSPLEQQSSQFAPCGMLLQGTRTGA